MSKSPLMQPFTMPKRDERAAAVTAYVPPQPGPEGAAFHDHTRSLRGAEMVTAVSMESASLRGRRVKMVARLVPGPAEPLPVPTPVRPPAEAPVSIPEPPAARADRQTLPDAPAPETPLGSPTTGLAAPSRGAHNEVTTTPVTALAALGGDESGAAPIPVPSPMTEGQVPGPAQAMAGQMAASVSQAAASAIYQPPTIHQTAVMTVDRPMAARPVVERQVANPVYVEALLGRRGLGMPLQAAEPPLDTTATVRRARSMHLDGADLTPLMRAAASASGNFVMQDLLANGVDVNATNSLGWTALMVAAYHDNMLGVHTLLQAGADVHMRDRAGQTARDKAVAAGSTWIARLLAKVEAHGVGHVLAEAGYPVKSMPGPVARPASLLEKPANHSLLASWELKSAGPMPKPYREPGPFMTDRAFS